MIIHASCSACVNVSCTCMYFWLFLRKCSRDVNEARRGGAEVAGWTLDRKIRVRFPAYPHGVWALWWQGGKRRLRTSRCPCRGSLDTLKTPSCPWRGCPAAGQILEIGHLSRHYIAEISLNLTLNHNQQQQQCQWNLTGSKYPGSLITSSFIRSDHPKGEWKAMLMDFIY